jgi:hypothetical protein
MMGSLQKRRDKTVFRIALWIHGIAALVLLVWLLR